MWNMRRNLLALTLAAAAMLGGAGLAQASPFIGVQYQRPNSGNHSPALDSSDVAGVAPQANYNVVQTDKTGPTSTGVLNDADGNATAVTLTFNTDDSFYSGAYVPGGDAAHTSNDAMLLAAEAKFKSSGSGGTFTFNNVPTGAYNLIAYIANDRATGTDFTAGGTTYYVNEQPGGDYAGSFVQATNTDPSGTRDTGNYVEFTNLSPAAGQITLTGESQGFSSAVNGLQLTTVPEPASLAVLGIGGLLMLPRRRKRA